MKNSFAQTALSILIALAALLLAPRAADAAFQVTNDDVLIVGHGIVMETTKEEGAFVPKDTPLYIVSPIGIAINQSLVAEMVSQTPIDIMVAVDKRKPDAAPQRYRSIRDIFIGTGGYIDLPDLYLEPLKPEERQKILAGAKQGQLIIEVTEATPLWLVLERNKDAITKHKQAHAKQRILWLACSSLLEEADHPTLIGNVPAALDYIRYRTIADTKDAIEAVKLGQQMGPEGKKLIEKAMKDFADIEATSKAAKAATTMPALVEALNKTEYGKGLAAILASSWYFN